MNEWAQYSLCLFFLGCCIWEPSMREINFRKCLVFQWSNECMDLLVLIYVCFCSDTRIKLIWHSQPTLAFCLNQLNMANSIAQCCIPAFLLDSRVQTIDINNMDNSSMIKYNKMCGSSECRCEQCKLMNDPDQFKIFLNW